MGQYRGGQLCTDLPSGWAFTPGGPALRGVLVASEATIATFALFLLEPGLAADRQGIRVGLVVFAPFVGPQILELAWSRVWVALRVGVVLLAVFVALVGGMCGARDGEHQSGRQHTRRDGLHCALSVDGLLVR